MIATGVYKVREIDIPNKFKNIFPAMEFLTASNRKGLGDKVKSFDDGTLNAKDKNIVVIGGGDTAMFIQKRKSKKICQVQQERYQMLRKKVLSLFGYSPNKF